MLLYLKGCLGKMFYKSILEYVVPVQVSHKHDSFMQSALTVSDLVQINTPANSESEHRQLLTNPSPRA